MVDLNSTLKEKYNYPENLANDTTSSVYFFANSMGETLGPIYGGYITYTYGFEFTCVLTGLFNLAFAGFMTYRYRNDLSKKIKVEDNLDDFTGDGKCYLNEKLL